jgi:hypothetical protein
MRKRAVRVTVFTFLLAANIAAAFFLWDIQRRTVELITSEDSVAGRVERMSGTVAAIGTAQHGYVAPGQLDEPWFDRMSSLLDQLNRDLISMRLVVRSAEAMKALAALSDSRDALTAADTRIRENLGNGQELMAADVIFHDGRTLVDALTASLGEVQRFERARTRVELAALERERWIVLGSAAFVWFIVVIALMSSTTARPTTAIAATAEHQTKPGIADTAATPPSGVDLGDVATLCTELSRVSETAALSELLGRGAAIVDASGTTLWLGAGEQLFAVLGHGYSQQTLARFGPIARDADNAVAKAWRTGRLAAVKGDGTNGGAIVAPMFGPTGCIGVLAFESRLSAQLTPSFQAAATVIAAQVATAVSGWPAASVSTPSAARPA